jgi:hypothetical protein
VLFQRWLYSLFPSSASGFSFGMIIPVGAIQPKEVAADNEGPDLLCSKNAFQYFFQKDSLS